MDLLTGANFRGILCYKLTGSSVAVCQAARPGTVAPSFASAVLRFDAKKWLFPVFERRKVAFSLLNRRKHTFASSHVLPSKGIAGISDLNSVKHGKTQQVNTNPAHPDQLNH